MSEPSSSMRDRLSRLQEACGTLRVSGGAIASDVPLVAVVSSRLGTDARLHWSVCRYLRHSLRECHRRDAEWLVGAGCAIQPWAERAAELFRVKCRILAILPADARAEQVNAANDSTGVSIDDSVIELADRVDAVYVRRGGLIEQCLRRRLDSAADGSVRVAVTRSKQCAAQGLIRQGAVGWINLVGEPLELGLPDSLPAKTRLMPNHCAKHRWCQTAGKWLIHCTRGASGPWPGESERQYRDSLLFGTLSSASRGPLDALLRIVRSGQLVASARASDHRHPVVCFSSLPLVQLLERRCFRSHLGRWDYEPYGVAIRTTTAAEQGVQPVIYGDRQCRNQLEEAQRYRFHPRGSRFDWSEEQEWRSCRSIDLRAIDSRNVRLFALDSERARAALSRSPWRVSFLAPVDLQCTSV